MPDFTQAIHKLARLDNDSPHERVHVIRQILDRVFQAGYEEGYQRALQDRGLADVIARLQEHAQAALPERNETDA